MSRINSTPALGSPTTRKGVVNALGQQGSIADTASGSADAPTINAILAALRSMELIAPPVIPTARYWRIRGAALSDPPWMQALEVEMRGSVGGADLTGGMVATSSTEYSGLGASRAIDDDLGTMWSTDGVTSTPGGEWLMVDFGSPVTIEEVSYSARTDSTRREPTDMVLEHSDDGVTFASYKEWTSLAWSAGETKVLS